MLFMIEIPYQQVKESIDKNNRTLESDMNNIEKSSSSRESDSLLKTMDTNLEMSPSTNNLDSPKTVLDKIYSNNFDRVTIPALQVIHKYLSNIISDPNEAKYRFINLQNKVFIEKVIPAKYSLEYLASIGFVAAIDSSNLIHYPHINIDILIEQQKVLEEGLEKLGVTIPLPKTKPLPQIPLQPVNAAVFFDPFKTSIVRNSQQV
jgi:hypothetical protein